MKYTGRIMGSLSLFVVHSLYTFYYYFRDQSIETLDLFSYPFLIFLGYWAGKQFDQVKFYSEKDELTGIYNRRFVIKTYEKIMAMAQRTSKKFFILIIDCDNFKTINDTYGHLKGDQVLKEIGEILTNSINKNEIAARWGGDEFLVIGSYIGESRIQTVLQNVRGKMDTLSDQVQIPIQASIGYATFPNDSKDLFELIKIADEKMYQSKTSKNIDLVH